MSTTLLELRTDYTEGVGPGFGSSDSAADRLRMNRAGDLYLRVLTFGLGRGIYPWPNAGSFQPSISSGLIAAIATGYGATLVGARGLVPMYEPGAVVTLPASKTGWYLFANVNAAGGLTTADSRDTGAVTYTTNASITAADGQELIAQFTTSGSAITSLIDMRTVLGPDGSGQLTKDVTGSADVTLTLTEARAGNLQFTGVLGANINVIVPLTPRMWRIRNDTTGAFTLTVKGATGTGISVTQGTGDTLVSDGTNVVRPTVATSQIASGTLALARGGTNADLSATGGANQVVKQTSVGGALTVAVLVAADIPTFAGTQIETMGTGAGTMTLSGSASTQTSAAGIGNAADSTDDTLFTYSLPLNSLSANGKGIRIVAAGVTAANGNDKRIKLWFAGTAIIDGGVITSNAKNWQAEAIVTRVDATHVSVAGTFRVDGGTAQVVGVAPNLVVADLTANASVVKSSGASPTTGAASDVLGYMQKVWMDN